MTQERQEAVEAALARLEASSLVADLDGIVGWLGRSSRIALSREHHSVPLAERLLEESSSALASGRPSEAAQLAKDAVAVVGYLEPRGSHGLLRARAWVAQGRALLRLALYEEGHVCLNKASCELIGAAVDGDGEGALLQASILCDRGWFEAAAARLAEAVDPRVSEVARARLLLAQAMALGHAGQGAEAVTLLGEAEPVLATAGRTGLALEARHHRAWWLSEQGEDARGAALELFEDASRRLVPEHSGDPHVRRQHAWLGARLCLEAGELAVAERLFADLWSRMHVANQPLDMALVTLDLCTVYLARDRPANAMELTARVSRLLEVHGCHRRVLEAWAVVRMACRTKSVNVELLKLVADYLRRGFWDPGRKFPQSSTTSEPTH